MSELVNRTHPPMWILGVVIVGLFGAMVLLTSLAHCIMP